MNNKRAVSSKIVKGCWKYQIVVKVAKTEEEKQVGEICIFQIVSPTRSSLEDHGLLTDLFAFWSDFGLLFNKKVC